MEFDDFVYIYMKAVCDDVIMSLLTKLSNIKLFLLQCTICSKEIVILSTCMIEAISKIVKNFQS